MIQRANSSAVASFIDLPGGPMSDAVARRRLLRRAAVGAVGVTAAMLAASVGVLIWPRGSKAVRETYTVAAADVPEVNAEPYLNPEGRFYLVHTEDGLLALSWRCTHLGCRTNWQGPVRSKKAFACPCHGSTFDDHGRRTGGPARRPLDLMDLRVHDDGSVTVNTEAVSTRSRYAAGQAVAS